MIRADRIRVAMAQKGLNDKRLSELSGVNRHTVAKLRKGEEVNPTVSTLEAIGGVLDLTLTDLLEEEPKDGANKEGSAA
jgi:transcriptional regulator with XRE-family HTH domain